MAYSKTIPKIEKKKVPKRNNFHPASFRDPSGSLIFKNDRLFRQVNFVYKENYNLLITSGLYESLVSEHLLISHKEVKLWKSRGVYKILEPQLIPFISYPYEWCFSQLKDAALLTLKIVERSLDKGLILKDASAYNVQFLNGYPILIDTLSFEKYREGEPWVAYQQFCRHFLSPLLLASYKDYRLMQLSKNFIDGISLDLTSLLLPPKSYLNFSVLSNIHLHAKSEKIMQKRFSKRKDIFISKHSLMAILDSLESFISGLKLKTGESEWQNYYQENSYDEKSLKNKRGIVKSLLKRISPLKSVWDLGANTGYFSKDMLPKNILVVNFDNDFLAIERNYQDIKKKKLSNTLPLVMDLMNPSSGVGWMNEERDSLIDRGPCDVVLALALVHHLMISNNLPFSHIADFLSHICRWLIIEYVPKDDLQIKKMLINRKDIFSDYNQSGFEKDFSTPFSIKGKVGITNSNRVIYLMKKR